MPGKLWEDLSFDSKYPHWLVNKVRELEERLEESEEKNRKLTKAIKKILPQKKDQKQ